MILKLKYEFTDVLGEGGVSITADVTSSVPKPIVKPSLFYASQQGNVSRSPIAQTDMFKTGEASQSETSGTAKTAEA